MQTAQMLYRWHIHKGSDIRRCYHSPKLLWLSPCSDAHEREVKTLNEQLREVARQRESALREVAELKTQLRMVEEIRDAIRRDLIDANRAIREGVNKFGFFSL